MTRIAWVAFLVVMAAPAAPVAPVAAQEATASGFAALEGVVVDSLRGGFLVGASVSVVGTDRLALTDSLGRYRIDSVPAGLHVVELSHEILDTLGVRVITLPLEFAADSTAALSLGVPSSQTIIRARCRPAPTGGGAVFGLVLDADSEQPLAGAAVQLSWIEWTASREIGLQYEPKQRTATTNAAGRYAFCGLPEELTAEITAARGGDSTSAAHVVFAGSGLGLATVFLATSDSVGNAGGRNQASAASGPVVRGVVVDSAGKPISDARVAIASSPDASVTDAAGTFELNPRRAGTQALAVRRLGYQPVEVSVNVSRRSPREITVRLKTMVPVLEAVLVEARRDYALGRVGFTDRRRSGMGTYLTAEHLDRRHALSVADYLTHIPSLRRGAGLGEPCITYWVDGMRWSGPVDDFMVPQEVGAIEAYSSSFVPAEFQSSGMCGVVVIWTKWKLGIR